MIESIKKFFRKKKPIRKNRDLSLAAINLLSTIHECNTIKSKKEIEAAIQLTEFLGIVPHTDKQKYWDTLKSLFYILKDYNSELPVLDAGGGPDSPILGTLQKFGYKKLYACDMIDLTKYTKKINPAIEFSVQKIENTNYPDDFFQVVTCLSVIEHGVDIEKFFTEMNRILQKQGLLLITTDYWEEYIDCKGIYFYGPEQPELKIYQKSEIEEVCRMAEIHGFKLCSPLKSETYEKAIRWDAVDREFTYIFLSFKKS
jgi:SAM-dependent methyltransferase